MKIFISHSSKNANYGQALVDLLVSIGINSEQIIFTSNDAFGIPTGQNIFNWLKARINEKPHVIYLLSTEYYSSIACLNEMGAAWIVENEHTIIFTPDFTPTSHEFQNGALDPREMGFKINNHDRVIAFIESLRTSFPVSTSAVFLNQKIREFLQKINSIETIKERANTKEPSNSQESKISNVDKSRDEIKEFQSPKKNIQNDNIVKSPPKIADNSIGNLPQVVKFFNDLRDGKLRDEEILLIHYAVDTARFKLGTGWKSDHEAENIKIWEEVNKLNSKLSSGYEDAIRRFDFKKLTEVTEYTSSSNPRQVMLISDLQEILLDMNEEINLKIEEAIARNERVTPSSSSSSWNNNEDLPF